MKECGLVDGEYYKLITKDVGHCTECVLYYKGGNFFKCLKSNEQRCKVSIEGLSLCHSAGDYFLHEPVAEKVTGFLEVGDEI